MSDSNKYKIESREVTKTKTFVTINEEEVWAAKVLDFIEELEGTDGFTYVRWSHKYNMVAEPMIEEGLVRKKNNGSWYAGDDEKLEILKSQLLDVYY